MDEKKKKGKKKKGNQSKQSASIFTAEDVNQSKPYHSAQNHHSAAPSNADSQSVGVSESDVDQEKHKNHKRNCVELQEEINKLEVEKNIWSQKEGFLEERIKILQNEVDTCIQKEASLDEKIGDLQSKNASLRMRESSIKEVVSKLGDANEGLQMQVMELKDSRDSLVLENKQLTASISTLESRLQHLEMVACFYASSKIHGEEKSQLKAFEASTKPDILNEDPSEKAFEMHAEPVQLAGTAENPASEKTIKHPSTMTSSSSTDYASEYNESILESNEKIGVNGSMQHLQQVQLLGLDGSKVSEDVISVPLDDIIEELQDTPESIEADPAVPLSDAPLIGAPFRLISFVARFVSGADLVDQDKPKGAF